MSKQKQICSVEGTWRQTALHQKLVSGSDRLFTAPKKIAFQIPFSPPHLMLKGYCSALSLTYQQSRGRRWTGVTKRVKGNDCFKRLSSRSFERWGFPSVAFNSYSRGHLLLYRHCYHPCEALSIFTRENVCLLVGATLVLAGGWTELQKSSSGKSPHSMWGTM